VGSIYRRRDDFSSGSRDRETRHAASRIVAIIGDVLIDPPDSVLDVGCGVGTFLAAFAANGTATIRGIEGAWMNREHFVVDAANVVTADLKHPIPDLGSFDLAVSLEVAEHLPPSRAESFVSDLCQCSDAILFSAAIPLQGGAAHLNEQWPSWWAQRFADCGYHAVDCVRPVIWTDDAISIWYRQNTVLYLRDGHRALERNATVDDLGRLDVVHPATYDDKVPGRSVPKATKALVRAIRRTVRDTGRR
jgi:SAM-dependent methyltransferase